MANENGSDGNWRFKIFNILFFNFFFLFFCYFIHGWPAEVGWTLMRISKAFEIGLLLKNWAIKKLQWQEASYFTVILLQHSIFLQINNFFHFLKIKISLQSCVNIPKILVQVFQFSHIIWLCEKMERLGSGGTAEHRSTWINTSTVYTRIALLREIAGVSGFYVIFFCVLKKNYIVCFVFFDCPIQ